MVPEIEWPLTLNVSAMLVRLRDTFLGCFHSAGGQKRQLVPSRHRQAFLCGKALLHLFYDRVCVREDEMRRLLDEDNHMRMLVIDLQREGGEHKDLEFVCNMIQRLFSWQYDAASLRLPMIPDSCLPWMLHLLPHCIYHRRRSLTLSDVGDVTIDAITRLFVLPPPPKNTLANCLLAASLLIRVPATQDELMKIDKSSEVNMLFDLFIRRLKATLNEGGIAHALRDQNHQSAFALKLLQPFAVLLEMEEYRAMAHDRGLSMWAIRLARDLARQHLSRNIVTRRDTDTPEVARLLEYSCAMLHLGVVSAGNLRYGPADERVMWDMNWVGAESRGDEGIPLKAIDEYEWLEGLLAYNTQVADHVAIADTLLVMSYMEGIEALASSATFIDTLVYAMSSNMPSRTRHVALRTVWAMKSTLATPKDEGIRESLLADFSPTLHSVLVPKMPSSLPWGQSSPDISFYYERNMHYAELVSALAQNALWHDHLHADGHVERCLTLASELRQIDPRQTIKLWGSTAPDHFGLCVAVTCARIYRQSQKTEPESFSDVVDTLVRRAWNTIHVFSCSYFGPEWPDYRSFIPPLAEYIIKRALVRSTDESVMRGILRRLKHEGENASDLSSVETLVELIDKDLRNLQNDSNNATGQNLDGPSTILYAPSS
ncbi:hypothetical protein BV22DRAFT_614895 [Leucogyrophana mollusca]|uniref:Uncharacterized protein n=1 Tax=Leucogyrophana mollusca TaxID=85980 RepID=A0ACB8BB43_9AGAM|nr:hypothetical protein BV22DRAFT_614895 [Leucogyrophana mollusca]